MTLARPNSSASGVPVSASSLARATSARVARVASTALHVRIRLDTQRQGIRRPDGLAPIGLSEYRARLPGRCCRSSTWASASYTCRKSMTRGKVGMDVHGLPPAEGKFASTVKVGAKGQIVIPKGARDLFGIKPGATLLPLADDQQGMTIMRQEVFDIFIAEAMPPLPGGPSLAHARRREGGRHERDELPRVA